MKTTINTKRSTPSLLLSLYVAITCSLCCVSRAAVVVQYYSDVVPYLATDSQFTVSSGGGGLSFAGAPTTLKVILFAEILRAGTYHIIGSLDNYSIRSKYPNGYGYIRRKTDTAWGLLDGERPDRYVAGVDYNGDGRIGLWDSTTESLIFDAGEYVSPEQITVSGVPPFHSGNGFQVQAVAIVPEPSIGWLVLIGAALLALLARQRRPNHALQRTAPRVTVAANSSLGVSTPSHLCPTSVAVIFAPPSQLPRHAPPSLSLGSLGD